MDDIDLRDIHDAWEDFRVFAGNCWSDLVFWVARLSDTEQLVLIATFILILFALILVNAGNRDEHPGNGRLFFMSVLMVGVFAFGVGWILDTRYNVFALL